MSAHTPTPAKNMSLPLFAAQRAAPISRGTIAAVDIGSSYVRCLIADCVATAQPTPFTRVLGFGQYQAQGIVRGQVVEMGEAENSIRAAVAQAEKVANVSVRDAYVGISSHNITPHHYTAQVKLNDSVVTSQHIRAVLREAYRKFGGDDMVLHAIPMSYSLDDAHNIKDPTGMVGKVLTAQIYLLTVPNAPIRNLMQCVSQSHLRSQQTIFSPYAAALATLKQDEKDLGALHIDMGANTTAISLFSNGVLLLNAIVPIGGAHVTNDIAQLLALAPTEAERVKKRFGSALPHSATATGREQFEVKYINGESRMMLCNKLTQIIRPRIEEIFESVANYLAAQKITPSHIGRVVLTGGASQLDGVGIVAEEILQTPFARLATPQHLSGLPDLASGADFAACVGVLDYAVRAHRDTILSAKQSRPLFGRITHWLGRHI